MHMDELNRMIYIRGELNAISENESMVANSVSYSVPLIPSSLEDVKERTKTDRQMQDVRSSNARNSASGLRTYNPSFCTS